MMNEVPPRVATPVSFLVCGLAVLLMGYLRFIAFPDHIVPLSFGVALLLCLWNRDRRFLWGMAIIFSGMGLLKSYAVLPGAEFSLTFQTSAALMTLANIWVVAFVIHKVLLAREKLETSNYALESANVSLRQLNEELSAREQQILQQNEELQAQTEELEQQTEELRQQAEELEEQGEELQHINNELAAKETGLKLLLDSSRWLGKDAQREETMKLICKAAVECMQGRALAAAIVRRRDDDRIVAVGHYGFGGEGPQGCERTFQQSLAAIVMERGSTAYIKDLSTRPDLTVLQPRGKPFSSVLASPLRLHGEIVGVLEVFSRESQDWSVENFRMLEWLAGQASLALEALSYQEQLAREREVAQESSRRKTRFLAAVSHDVRTPANAIGLLADLIGRYAAGNGTNTRIAELALSLKRSAKSLIELVSDVLDLTRFDSDRFETELQAFSVWDLIETEIGHHVPLAENKGISLVAALPEKDFTIRSDKLKLARVLGNLIGNAVKFTENGGVKVGLRIDGQSGAAIDVVDTGTGIPGEHLHSIFDEFFQLKNRERDRTKGSGLGLAICKRLADGLGLRLTVHSSLNVGSTFSIHVPASLIVQEEAAAVSQPSVHRQSAANEDGPRLRGLRVLLIEDHGLTRATMKEILEAEGAVVASMDDGRGVVQAVRHEDPDVILLDLMLPTMDGTEVLAHIKELKPNESLNVLVISGNVTPFSVSNVKALGADDLIPKPVQMGPLVERLIEYLPESRRSNVVEFRKDGVAA